MSEVKGNPRFSASRFGTFLGCKQKYKLVYKDELVVVGRDFEVTGKGLAFHSIAENMLPGDKIEKLYETAETILGKADFDQEKYPVIKSIPRFYLWWQEYVEKYLSQGYKLFKENWEYGTLEGMPLCGAIDVLLINEKTKDVRIYDYKTGSSAKIAGYENQLLLYAWMIANRLKIKEDEISDKIKTYLFFPLAGIKTEDPDDKEKVEKNMLKTMKQLIYSNDDVNTTINLFKDIIHKDIDTDWDKLDPIQEAQMSYACSFCSFVGHPKYCPLSYQSNCRFPRKAKVMTKEESKKLVKA